MLLADFLVLCSFILVVSFLIGIVFLFIWIDDRQSKLLKRRREQFKQEVLSECESLVMHHIWSHSRAIEISNEEFEKNKKC